MAWINDFFDKDLMSPFIIEKDNDYRADLSKKYSILIKKAKEVGADADSLRILSSSAEAVKKALLEYYKGNVVSAYQKLQNLVKKCIDEDVDQIALCGVNDAIVFHYGRTVDGSVPELQLFRARAQEEMKTLKAKKIAIISVDLDFGATQIEAFKAQLEKMGSDAEIVYEQAIAISDSDMSSAVTAAAAAGADLIYSVNYYEQAAQVLREVGQKGLDIPVLGCEGADSFELLNIAGEYANGLYITTNMNRDDQNAETQAYIENYVNEYGIQPDMVGASVYDAFQVLFAAMKEVGTDTQAMREYIAGMENFDTVTGTLIRYNEDGSAVKPVQIQLVTDGEYHSAGTIDDMEVIDPANYQ